MLRRIVIESDTRPGRIFDLAIQALIVVSLVSFAVETLPDLSDETRRLLRLSEVVIVAVFTVEYVLRLLLEERPIRYATSFLGLIDIGAILPFYVTTGVDLRSLRAFRLLRVFRVFKLARYSAAVRRFSIAFKLVREELILFCFRAG